MTNHQKLKSLTLGMNWKEINFLGQMLEGLDGCGELNNEDITEYLTDNQIRYIKGLHKRYIVK